MMDDVIYLEQILAGALLKFDKLDNVDISLILNDFIDKCSLYVNTYISFKQLGGYVRIYESGMFTRNEERPLDYYIEEEKRTVLDKYREIAGSFVLEYFDKIDVVEFREKKDNILKSQAEELKDKANILLISDIEEEYNQLIEYGFKNVDYFRSVVRANNYFKGNSKELEKYHIVLTGHSVLERYCFEGNINLERILIRLRNEHKILKGSLARYDYLDYMKYVAYLNWEYGLRNIGTEGSSYFSLFDRIIEWAVIKRVLDKVGRNEMKFKPIEDYVNSNRLSLPSKKSDLKILYLETLSVNDSAYEIADKLGLNIAFREDNNISLGNYVVSNLGDYDIIIASSLYSRNILGMNNESTEQCKDSGRDLTLLVSYGTDDFNCYVDGEKLGDRVDIRYVFGGILGNQERYCKEFRVLRQPFKSNKPEKFVEYDQRRKSDMQAIIESAVSVYNDYLLEKGKPGLIDFDLRSSEQYDNKYEEELRGQAQVLETIRDINNLVKEVLEYVKYRNICLISDVQNIKITETDEDICIENILNGRTLCVIKFSKKDIEPDLKIFTIQTLNNKGRLCNPETVGLYSKKYENLSNIPKKASEKQLKIILDIKKIIDVAVNKELGSLSKYKKSRRKY